MTTPSIPGQPASASSASGPQAQAQAHHQAYHRRKTRAKAKSEALRHKEAAHVEALPVLHPHAAGIDIGSRSHWVCVGFTSEAPSCLIQEFPAHTAGLKAVVAFLHEHQVTAAGMQTFLHSSQSSRPAGGSGRITLAGSIFTSSVTLFVVFTEFPALE